MNRRRSSRRSVQLEALLADAARPDPQGAQAWLEVWQRIDIVDMYYFPLWEKGVHDLLQKHFQSWAHLPRVLPLAARLGSAEDAMEMEMSEFKDFVDECGLETKQ